MNKDSRIVIEYENKNYGVVLPVQGLFVSKVKELVVEKLKLGWLGEFENIKAGYLTIYSDQDRSVKITDKRMPTGDEFHAKLMNSRVINFDFSKPKEKLLCETSGRKWKYQYDPSIFAGIRKDILQHY